MKIVIAGAGMGGLAAAICCAKAGSEVIVLEKNSQVGGKLWSYSAAGFTFDCGPSLLTLPGVLQRLCAENYDKLQVRPLKEICHYFWNDGTEIISHSTPEVFAKNIASVTEDNEERYLNYFAKTSKLYKNIAPLFLTQDIHSLSLAKSKLFWKALPRIPLHTSAITLHDYNRSHFHSPKVQQIFDRFATYIGSSPYQTTAVYSLISFVEHGMGAYYPAKGMRTIPQILKTTAEQHGVNIILNERIQQIQPRTRMQKKHIITTSHRNYACDALIANIDAIQLDGLLESQPTAYPLKKRTTSAIVYLWGINCNTNRLGFHNILFSDDYREEFDALFRQHVVAPNPTIYINISSKKIASDAPPGKENWFVMVNVPARINQDWQQIAKTIRPGILKRISRLCRMDIATHIAYERNLTPVDFASISGEESGSLYGMNVHGILGTLQRPKNKHNAYRHLYRCGGTTHPGGGVPLALLSGCIAATRCSQQNISFLGPEYLAIP